MKRVITLDFGSTKSHTPWIYDSHKEFSKGDFAEPISTEEFMALPEKLPKGSWIISEAAHLGVPRTRSSLAQPFIERELLDFYSSCEENGIKLRLFPESQCPKTHGYSGLWKSEMNDPVSLYLYIRDIYGFNNLMKPKRRFGLSDQKIEGVSIRKDIGEQLNSARTFGYTDYLCRSLKNQEFHESFIKRLDPETRFVFDLGEKVRGNRTSGLVKGQWDTDFISWNSYYCVWSSLIEVAWDEEKQETKDELYIRLRDNGRIMGLRYFKKHILGNSPHHLKGGVLRSNVMFHNFPAYMSKSWKIRDGWKPELTGDFRHQEYKLEGPSIKGHSIFEYRDTKDEKSNRVVKKPAMTPDMYTNYKESLKKHRTAIFDLFKNARDVVNENRNKARINLVESV